MLDRFWSGQVNTKPKEVQTKNVDMLMCTKETRLETYGVKVELSPHKNVCQENFIKFDLSGKFYLSGNLSKKL